LCGHFGEEERAEAWRQTGRPAVWEIEHESIRQFVEESPDLLPMVPMIPFTGPTPEEAEARAQGMAAVLGTILSRRQQKAAIPMLAQVRGETIGPLSVSEWSVAIGCGETKMRDLFDQWGIDKLHGGYSVPQSLLTEQQRTKAKELFEKRQNAAETSILRRMSTKLKRVKH
jgi:hypothetical protein